ncbi:MAG: AAA family ATPase [Chloroflexota bacterium]
MTESNEFETPTLIVVTGRPGSGKTTLAHALAREIRCPAVSRDEIKEGFVNTTKNTEIQKSAAQTYASNVFFETLAFLLSKRITLVAEAAFQHKVWVPKLEPLQKVAHIRLVLCSLDPPLARWRFVQRRSTDPQRGYFHGDGSMQTVEEIPEQLIATYQPPMMDVPTLAVDTANGYDPGIKEIVTFIYNPENKSDT